MTFAEIARELYALPPDEFTAERNRRAKDAPAGFKTLRKPSAAAWLVNMLVRHEQQTIDDIADLGDRMRDAQQSLDRDTMRSLAQERRQQLSAAIKIAAALAQRLGHPASPSTLTDVEATLVASISDPAAADAVRSGMLVRSLSADDDASDAVATGAPAGQKRRQPKPVADLSAEREKRRDQARAELAEAEAVAKKAARLLRTAHSERESLEGERDALRAELEFAESELARADETAKTAERVSVKADSEASAIRRRLNSLD